MKYAIYLRQLYSNKYRKAYEGDTDCLPKDERIKDERIKVEDKTMSMLEHIYHAHRCLTLGDKVKLGNEMYVCTDFTWEKESK
jgi:hypothetical protein